MMFQSCLCSSHKFDDRRNIHSSRRFRRFSSWILYTTPKDDIWILNDIQMYVCIYIHPHIYLSESTIWIWRINVEFNQYIVFFFSFSSHYTNHQKNPCEIRSNPVEYTTNGMRLRPLMDHHIRWTATKGMPKSWSKKSRSWRGWKMGLSFTISQSGIEKTTQLAINWASHQSGSRQIPMRNHLELAIKTQRTLHELPGLVSKWSTFPTNYPFIPIVLEVTRYRRSSENWTPCAFVVQRW